MGNTIDQLSPKHKELEISIPAKESLFTYKRKDSSLLQYIYKYTMFANLCCFWICTTIPYHTTLVFIHTVKHHSYTHISRVIVIVASVIVVIVVVQ